MTKKLALLTVHGMGETKRDYARSLKERLDAKLWSQMNSVAFCPIYYQEILQPNEAEIWNRSQRTGGLHYDDLRKFFLFGFADAAGLENRKELPASVYEDAQIEIARTMLKARNDMGGDGPVIVIAQSLGCQVFSSYIYDAQKASKGMASIGIWRNIDLFSEEITNSVRPLTSEEKSFLAGDTIVGLVTTGCNIPIFVAAHKRMAIIPIEPPTPQFKWLNFYDPDDVLGWPLQPLSDGYAKLVKDHRINAGHGLIKWLVSWTPMSHGGYWEDDDVLKPLTSLLKEGLSVQTGQA
jgi:hypothetical protein